MYLNRLQQDRQELLHMQQQGGDNEGGFYDDQFENDLFRDQGYNGTALSLTFILYAKC